MARHGDVLEQVAVGVAKAERGGATDPENAVGFEDVT
jgi:hypothetical protein